jgi:hypothetical protein
MELDEARDLLRKCQDDREGARESMRAAAATIESSQLIIQGVLKRFPELAVEEGESGELWEPESTDRPRGSEAVLSILLVAEDQWFSVLEVVEALAERSLLPASDNPANAVRTALERLKGTPSSHVHKGRRNSGTVVYRYSEQEGGTPPEPQGYGYSEEPF